MFEDIKRVIRSHFLFTNKKHNCQKRTKRQTLVNQNNTQKTKNSATRITQKIEDDLCATESSAVPIPLVFQHLFIKTTSYCHGIIPLFLKRASPIFKSY